MNQHVKEKDLSAITVLVSLDQLRHGSEYPGGSVNSRTAYRDHDIEQLAHSLMPENDGQLKPLLCCTHKSSPNLFYVFDGGRREAAFTMAIKQKLLPKEHSIEIKDFGQIEPQHALQLSWAANEQVPLHPADRFAVFARMQQEGSTAKEIADQRGMTVKAVEQSLAFGGKLAPESLESWRKSEITKDIAQILTVGSFEDQVELLDTMRKKHGTRSRPWSEHYGIEHEMRKALNGNEVEAARLLKFVGEDAYVAAGGIIAKDLFSEKGGTVVQNFALLKKLARAKLKPKVIELTAAGWSWVDTQITPHFMDHQYGKSKDKAKAGCVVRIAGTKIEVKSGLTKKGQGKNGPAAGAGAPKAEAPDMDHNAMRALDHARSEAAGTLLAKDPRLSLAAVAATLATGIQYGDEGPLGMEVYGDCQGKSQYPKNWADAFAMFAKKDIKAIAQIIANVIPRLVEFGRGDGKPEQALLSALDPKALAAAIPNAFDAKEFFAGCSKKFLLAIVDEVLGAEEARKVAGREQAQLAKFCSDSVTAKGWLPKDLRTKLYVAPKPKTVVAKPAKAKAVKKGKKGK